MNHNEGIKKQFTTKALVLIPVVVGINLVGGMLCSLLKLPLFLDMIGTILIACLVGPWAAAICGLTTNVFLALVANPVYLPYSVVSILCGVTVGFMVRGGFFKSKWRVVVCCLVCTLVNTISASLVTFFVYGGATGINSTSVLTAVLIASTKEILLSVVSTSMLENLVDKAIVFVIVYLLIRKIPQRFLSQYSVRSILK